MSASSHAGYLAPLLFLLAASANASSADAGAAMDFTGTGYGFLALTLFILAYAFVILEEFLHLRKSKPVVPSVRSAISRR